MLCNDPAKRPTAKEVVEELRSIIASLSDADLREPLRPKKSWSFAEKMQAVKAILQGKGDEAILFARLRGTKPPRKELNFSEGPLKDRLELTRRVFRFLWNVSPYGGVLIWIAPKEVSKGT